MHKIPIHQRVSKSFFRFLFKLLYTHFAWSYDWVAAFVSLGKWNTWVLSVLPYLKGESILELGFGPGHLMHEMQKKGYHVVGLDASWQMCRRVSTVNDKKFENGVIVNGYAQYVPFSNKSFENIVATFPSDYIFNQATLSEIHRVLIPGGSLVVLPYAWISSPRWFCPASSFLSKLSNFSSDWNSQYLTPIIQSGFEVNTELIKNDSSSIVIIVAHKLID
ncbi:MAG: methyltransferase domain-containing protein [Anaerolineales bacterium]|nr:methyltransferase domain-containing protein [Anaerolineales bacterium]